MPSVEYDLRYLQAGIPELEKYLLASEVYWPIGARPPAGEPGYPQLTLGGLLLAQARAHAKTGTSEQQAELARLDEQMDEVRAHWRVAWGQKAAAEFHARLNLWRSFIDEYRENPEANYDRYPYEVSRRVMLKLLSAEAAQIPAVEEQLLAGMDKYLQSVLQPVDFVWEPELSARFPRGAYWYLYGTPRKS